MQIVDVMKCLKDSLRISEKDKDAFGVSVSRRELLEKRSETQQRNPVMHCALFRRVEPRHITES